MTYKSVLFFILTTELFIIVNALAIHINAGLVDDYDMGQYKLPARLRFKRGLNGLNDVEYFSKGGAAGFIPDYLKVFDILAPPMKNKMEMVKDNLFLLRSLGNYSPEDIPQHFKESEPVNSSRDGYANERGKETYQDINVRPEEVLTDPMIVENVTPNSFAVHGNRIDWEKGDEDQVALNVNSDAYNAIGNINSNLNEEVFNINQSLTESDSSGDGVIGCYKQCLQNCYGTSSIPPISHCEPSQPANPLIINIHGESCLPHPSQRFHRMYSFKPKLNGNPLKFHRKIHKYSSCPFSEIPPFYY